MTIAMTQAGIQSGAQSGIHAANFEKARFSAASGRLTTAKDNILASQADGNRTEGNQEVRKAAETFEAVFLGQMLAPMFAGLGTDGPFGGGHAEEIYRSMLVDEMGNSIANTGDIGIADAIYDHLLRLQEI